jgi:hypothetical protein
VGGVETCVPENGPFSRVLTSEGWGESEGLGTVRKLDLASRLFIRTWNGGEGGIRSRRFR